MLIEAKGVKRVLKDSRPGTVDSELSYFSGWLGLAVFLLLLVGFAFVVANVVEALSAISDHHRQPRQSGMGLGLPLFGAVVFFAMMFGLGGFTVLQPNTALVATFFGSYAGTLRESGFFWLNPFYSCQRISLRAHNHVTPVMKVNDGNGNPIDVAAAIVWHVEYPAKAQFDVENIADFVSAQSESALRTLVSAHPYEHDEKDKASLRLHADVVLDELRSMVQGRLEQAGIRVDEARFTHLAYAAEIAQAMLRRQQAQAVIAARETIVNGAVAIVEKAVNTLTERKIVEMTASERSKLVTNMLTVLLSENGVQPTVSVGNT